MRKYCWSVDLRSRAEMTRFLETHFRYHTMNSWNRAQSYACNLKISRLGLDYGIENKLYDMLDSQEFFHVRREPNAPQTRKAPVFGA